MKSLKLQIVLIILFGPLGLMYSSPWFSLALTAIFLMGFGTGYVPFLSWVVAMAIGISEVDNHNKFMKLIKTKTI